MHGVAGGTTELRRLHVFNGTVGNLGADRDVGQSCDTEEPSQAMQLYDRTQAQPVPAEYVSYPGKSQSG